MKKGYLVLQNGQVFEGIRFGAGSDETSSGQMDSIGELVFTTGMVGYLETLTDPSYYGQIVMQTFPQIGNYGVISEDFEGDSAVRGYVVRQLCETPSNFRCEKTLDAYLKEIGIPGLYGVDTRELTRIIRENGTMNAIICDEVPSDLTAVQAYRVANAVRSVTKEEILTYQAEHPVYKVALIDYGAKQNIIRELCRRGCDLTVYPPSVKAETLLAGGFDGVMLSNGPGDPAENTEEIAEIKKLISRIPLFGICLGHQLLALALGGKTEKLKYGHRGANQPVKQVDGTRTYITSQNHGYAVVAASLAGIGKEIFVNANDGTCEGMSYEDQKAFSVQFHPEACAGPHDTSFLFDRFIMLMEEHHA
ncbi:MAG: glutamine-hydrolyzing carbamoyl-phosphate synthase small subunit [Clostridiales bacterium]|nr:glutamine-hydrolyzing carbamoyl-phosphate synthase small subunit [Clostridiales bacterium]